ncbi:MAG: hypothetical protein ACAH83_17465, partial [Alphaproteobacteria bacterium]
SVSTGDIRKTLSEKLTKPALVDWAVVDVAVQRRDGMPVSIGKRVEMPVVAEAPANPPSHSFFGHNTGGFRFTKYYANTPSLPMPAILP